MTCADRIRDLHAAVRADSTWAVDGVTEIHRALPEIAAVIEAAEHAADAAHDGDLADWGDMRCTLPDGCSGCELRDALAALARRLETQT